MGYNLVGGIAMLVMLGCGAREPAAPDPPVQRGSPQQPISNESKQLQREDLVARAEQSLAVSLPLDYGRAMNGAPMERPETVSLFLAACRAGDKPSCWLAWRIQSWSESGDAMTLVRTNCLGGDLMSCRALPESLLMPKQKGFPDAPGAAGRSKACWMAAGEPEAAGCDVTVLRRECAERYPNSCKLLPVQAASDGQDLDTIIAHTLELSREGCRLRIDGECDNVIAYGTEQEQEQALERMCPVTIVACDDLSKHYLKRGDVLRARDSAERACQHWRNPNRRICMNLGQSYLTGVFPEPVPGRGKALVAWVCESPEAAQLFPTCKSPAAKKQQRRSSKPR